MARRVLAAGDLAGFAPYGQPGLGLDAASWAVKDQYPPSLRARETARLRSLGFLAGARQRLTPANGGPAEAISVVERFRTPSAARAELRAELRLYGHGQVFDVPAISGGRGFAGASGEASGQNVAFTKGPYLYLLGAGAPTGVPSPSRAVLIAAAVRLYRRLPA
jgi:hypothetical protein